jgi:hypothetical protein
MIPKFRVHTVERNLVSEQQWFFYDAFKVTLKLRSCRSRACRHRKLIQMAFQRDIQRKSLFCGCLAMFPFKFHQSTEAAPPASRDAFRVILLSHCCTAPRN